MSSACDLSVPGVWTKCIQADLDTASSVPDHVNKAKIAIKWVKNDYIKKLHTIVSSLRCAIALELKKEKQYRYLN